VSEEEFQEVAVERQLAVAELDDAINPVDMVFATIAGMEARVQAAVEAKSDYRRSGPARIKFTYIQPVTLRTPAEDGEFR
jgi:hypothetical protein